MNKEKITTITAEICRIILGLTFIFSGFTKSVDPYGTAYKITDYFAAFHLPFLSSFSMFISFFLCAFEFLLGIFMLLGIFRKWNSRLVLLTMCFMTPLTLYLAIADPVSDCGCFGDAVVISNWNTFYKNVVLLVCAVFVFFTYKRLIPVFKNIRGKRITVLYVTVFTTAFLFYNYLFEPAIDFRPYKIGANLPELMTVSEDKQRIEERLFIYEKDGLKKEFTAENLPWEDSTWVYVDMKTTIIREGEEPVISDFYIRKIDFDKENNVVDELDITEEILSNGNYTFLLIAPILSELSEYDISRFYDIVGYSRNYGYDVFFLTASGTDEIAGLRNKIPVEFCNTDEKVLKTIVRSLPGLLLLKDGIIVNKWGKLSIPEDNHLNRKLDELSYVNTVDDKKLNKRNLLIIALLLFVPIMIVKGAEVYLQPDKSVA